MDPGTGRLLADGAGAPLDQGVASLLFVATLLFGWLAYARLRGRGFSKLPRAAGWGAAGLAATSLVLALVLPPIIRPSPPAARPASTGELSVASPRPGQVFHGDPAVVPVVLRLTGARVTARVSTDLTPDEGHIHLYVAGGLIAMTFGLRTTATLAPGVHVLRAEFVAVDHAPFRPPVVASVRFRVVPQRAASSRRP